VKKGGNMKAKAKAKTKAKVTAFALVILILILAGAEALLYLKTAKVERAPLWVEDFEKYERNPVIEGDGFDANLKFNPGVIYDSYKNIIKEIQKMKKYRGNPILYPEGTGWESMAVLNPAVMVENGIFYMLYRGDDWTYVRWIEDQPLPKSLMDERWKGGKEKGGWASIGLAYSKDGIHFERCKDNPIIVPAYNWEKPWGCEEPRIVKIDNTYILTYRGGGRHIALATSNDLIHWEKKGICFPKWESTNSGVIVPEKINGQYIMYHGDSNIWIAYSNDLIHWVSPQEPVMKPREGYFDDSLVEPGPPPIVTEDGIVLIYHGKNKETWAYSLGVVVFSKKDPTKILYRSDKPFLEPTEEWEINGKAYNVIFSNGLVNYKGKWYLYYGGADTYIGVAISGG
jgi:predicted GH43/DUF377 family glycosyl hydrolase